MLTDKLSQIPQPMGSKKRDYILKKLNILFVSLFLLLSNIVLPHQVEAASGGLKVKTYGYKGQPYIQITNHPNKTIANKINKTLKSHAVAAAIAAKDSVIQEYDGWYKTSARTVYNKNGRLSVVYETSAYYGGAHDIQWTTTYNFDSTTGKRILLNNVLNSQTKILKANQYTQYILQVKNSKSEDEYDTEAVIDMKKGNFYFRDHGITLVFDPYEVASFSLGSVEVTVPSGIINGTQSVPIFTKPKSKIKSEKVATPKSALLSIYSNDKKTFLGNLSTNTSDTDSIFNKQGNYGNAYGFNSIWNPYGTYGSETSMESAFNKNTIAPPVIMYEDMVLNYITVNKNVPGGVSPDRLWELAKAVDTIKD